MQHSDTKSCMRVVCVRLDVIVRDMARVSMQVNVSIPVVLMLMRMN